MILFSGCLTGVLLQFSRYDIIQCGVPLTNANYVIILIPFGLLMIGSLAGTTQLRLSVGTVRMIDDDDAAMMMMMMML